MDDMTATNEDQIPANEVALDEDDDALLEQYGVLVSAEYYNVS